MADTWTTDQSVREGWYWVQLLGVLCTKEPFAAEVSRHHGDPPDWGFYAGGRWLWLGSEALLGPRIPPPDELAAMEEYIAASEEYWAALEGDYIGLTECSRRLCAARAALRKIRESGGAQDG